MKKALTIILCLVLVLLCAAPALAAPGKDESIYASLNYDGSVRTIQAVNRFTEIPAGKPLTDYGTYKDVQNLSTDDQPVIEDDRVTWDLGGDPPGEFYYQASLSKALPYTVEIRYMLDGKYVDGDTLGDKTGHITIGMDIRSNPDCDEALRKNVMVQASVSLDSETCRNIQADGATLVVMGGMINLAYTVLPEEDASYTLSMDAEDFAMGGITFNLISYTNMLGDFEDDLSEFTDGFDTMADSMGEMADGTGELKDGLGDMVDGLHDMDSGLTDLSDGAGEFGSGLSDFGDGIDDLHDGMVDLADGSQKIEKGLRDIDGGGASLLENYRYIYSILASSYPSDPVVANLNALNEGLSDYLDGISALNQNYHPFHRGIQALPVKIKDMKIGFNDLYDGYTDIEDGIGDLADGMHTMYTETSRLPDDVQELIDGQIEFRDGIIEAKDETRDKIDSYFPEDTGSPVSFVDERNTVRSVQYMLKTPDIEKAEKATPDLEGNGEHRGFFQRLLTLFKK